MFNDFVDPVINKSFNLNELTNYVIFVLDKSGSMFGIKSSIISLFNEQIDSLKSTEAKNMNTKVGLVTFNHHVDEPLLWNSSIDKIAKLDGSNYIPEGSTSLYDAIGFTIQRLQKEPDINEETTSVLFICLTDGEENSSQEFVKGVKDIVEECKATERWTFTFFGANQDVVLTSRNTGINNSVAFAACASDIADLSFNTSSSTKDYMRSRTLGVKSVSNFYKNVV